MTDREMDCRTIETFKSAKSAWHYSKKRFDCLKDVLESASNVIEKIDSGEIRVHEIRRHQTHKGEALQKISIRNEPPMQQEYSLEWVNLDNVMQILSDYGKSKQAFLVAKEKLDHLING